MDNAMKHQDSEGQEMQPGQGLGQALMVVLLHRFPLS